MYDSQFNEERSPEDSKYADQRYVDPPYSEPRFRSFGWDDYGGLSSPSGDELYNDPRNYRDNMYTDDEYFEMPRMPRGGGNVVMYEDIDDEGYDDGQAQILDFDLIHNQNSQGDENEFFVEENPSRMQVDPMREQMSPPVEYVRGMMSPQRDVSGQVGVSPNQDESNQRARLLQRSNVPIRAIPQRGMGNFQFANNSMLSGNVPNNTGGGLSIRTLQQDPSNLNSPAGRKGSMSTDSTSTRTPSTSRSYRYARTTPSTGGSNTPGKKYVAASKRGFK